MEYMLVWQKKTEVVLKELTHNGKNDISDLRGGAHYIGSLTSESGKVVLRISDESYVVLRLTTNGAVRGVNPDVIFEPNEFCQWVSTSGNASQGDGLVLPNRLTFRVSVDSRCTRCIWEINQQHIQVTCET
jgi:hypothetical protein